MTALDVLREARRLYAECPSHAPATDFPADGTRCVVMAFDAALRDDRSGDSFRHFTEVEQAFAAAMGAIPAGIVAFNAEHSTEEVLAVFDKAIEEVAA